MRGWGFSLFGLCLAWSAATPPVSAAQPAAAGTVEQTICPLVESAAHASNIGVGLLTRIIWAESRFEAHVVSTKGAQGIAQFTPDTAADRGLADPFDPEQAIPKAAQLLADFTQLFGNVGLAVAAYNAGANRATLWLAGTSRLPTETAAYVISPRRLPRSAIAKPAPRSRPRCVPKAIRRKGRSHPGACNSPAIFQKRSRSLRSHAPRSVIAVSLAICSR